MKRPEVNRWSFLFGWRQDYWNRSGGWRILDIAFIRLHTMPEEGEAMTHGKHLRRRLGLGLGKRRMVAADERGARHAAVC